MLLFPFVSTSVITIQKYSLLLHKCFIITITFSNSFTILDHTRVCADFVSRYKDTRWFYCLFMYTLIHIYDITHIQTGTIFNFVLRYDTSTRYCVNLKRNIEYISKILLVSKSQDKIFLEEFLLSEIIPPKCICMDLLSSLVYKDIRVHTHTHTFTQKMQYFSS